MLSRHTLQWLRKHGAWLCFMGLMTYSLHLGASRHAQAMNRVPAAKDQSAYVNMALRYMKDKSRLSDGARGPLYTWLLSAVVSPERSMQDNFERAREFGVWLSAALLWLCVGVFAFFLPRWQASSLALACAFPLLTFYSSYVKAEAAAYVFGCAAFAFACLSLVRPKVWTGVLAGASLGFLHLAKATALPILGLYLLISAAAALSQCVSTLLLERHKRQAWLSVLAGQSLPPLLALLTFVCVTGVYLIHLKQTFGSYAYNVNTNFYIWYDSWAEVERGTRAYGDRVGWPTMAPEDIPNLRWYLARHSTDDVLARLTTGLRGGLRNTIEGFGVLRYEVIYTLALLTACLTQPQKALALALRYWHVVLFAAGYLLFCMLGAAWFYSIQTGPRFIMTLYMPILFGCAAVLHRAFGRPAVVLFGRETQLDQALLVVVMGTLAYDVPWIVMEGALQYPQAGL